MHFVGENGIVANELIALRREQDDIALRANLVGFAVPDHAVSREILAVAHHPDGAVGGHDIRIAVVNDLIGAEVDGLFGGRCRGSWSRLTLGVCHARQRNEHGKRRPPDKFRPQRRPSRRSEIPTLGQPIAPDGRRDNRPVRR